MSTTYTKKTYDDHINKEHRPSFLSAFIKEIVYGGNDGIVTTFAVVAGFTGAASSNTGSYSILTVLLFGLANLFADGAAMGLGNFLSVKAEKDVYHSQKMKEKHEIRHNKDMEKAETEFILKERGFTKEQAKALTDIMATNHDYWLEFMMIYELELPNPENENAFLNGLATFISFIIFGFIPLIPYLITANTELAFKSSCLITLFALMLLGTINGLTSKRHVLRSIIETVMIGGTSAIIAFIVGTFFK